MSIFVSRSGRVAGIAVRGMTPAATGRVDTGAQVAGVAGRLGGVAVGGVIPTGIFGLCR